MKFTIIGGRGFIGGALAARLLANGEDVETPVRGDPGLLETELGHVVYAAGVTADFRSRPFDALRAHASLLADVLEHARFDSLLYLSTARVYRNAEHGGEEAAIRVRSNDPEDLYELTKLAGEAMCHASGRGRVCVVRLTNVVGADFKSENFLTALIRAACDRGHVELRSAPESAKDYVLLDDVLDVLPKIALHGRRTCYNIGGGRDLRHSEVLAPLLAASGAVLRIMEHAPVVCGPPIDISRLRSEFGYSPAPVLPRIPELFHQYRNFKHAEN